MSILSTTTSGVSDSGSRIVISGSEKIGKTTLACGAPNAYLVPLEVGFAQVSIPKSKMVESYSEIIEFLDEVTLLCQQGQFPYKTIVFDSATALERHIHTAVIQSDSSYGKSAGKSITMETALGGFGRAYGYATEMFDSFLKRCDILAVYGKINIIITCHVFPAKLIDPINGEYDSWDLQLYSPKNQKTFGKRELLTQWADIVGFLYEPMYVSEGEKVNKAVSMNQGRILGINRTPSYVAGNRYGIAKDIPIPFQNGWNHLAEAIFQSAGIDLYTR